MSTLIQAAGVSPRFLDLLAREPLSDLRVLDVGCGSGRLTIALAPAARSVVGLDRDTAALDE
ncbi:MAG TPA: methyltransferase domain-containing protein, partial [Methylomirabilota bacterium]|nr:methyltransferase domain-containing protein [Methylomirabilota bacterium]